MTNSTETFFIRLYSTDARLSWGQFQCILMDIVTLSTDTNDCDLRHQCISEFDLHLCTWAQCCSGNGHNFFGTYSTLLYGQFHSYIFLWPIPALTFGVTYSTDASGPNSKLNFVTYSSTPSRPYSVPPFKLLAVSVWSSIDELGNWQIALHRLDGSWKTKRMWKVMFERRWPGCLSRIG